MGYLADFVKDKMTREHEDRLQQLNGWSMLANDPRADTPTQQWAIENLLGLHKDAGKHIKDGTSGGALAGVFNQLKSLVGLKQKQDSGTLLNPQAGGGGQQSGMQSVQQPRPAFSPRLRSPEELATESGRVADITARAQTPALVDRARQSAQVTQDFAPPITKELADGTIVQWDPKASRPDGRTGDWIQASTGGTPMRGTTPPPSLINGKDGAPIGIRRPTGAILTDPNTMLPDEKALFVAAGDVYQADLDRDEEKLRVAQEKFDTAQANMEKRLQESIGAANTRSQRTYDYQTANALRDDYRSQTTNAQSAFPAKLAAYQNINSLRDRLIANKDTRTAPDDIALLYNFIRMNDPNRVTEGELDLVRRGQTTPENILQTFQTITGIDARLMSQPLRESLLRTADTLFSKSIKPQIEAVNQQYRTQAQQASIPESALMLIDPNRGLGGVAGGTSGSTGNQRVTIDGKNYEVDANGTIIKLLPAGTP